MSSSYISILWLINVKRHCLPPRLQCRNNEIEIMPQKKKKNPGWPHKKSFGKSHRVVTGMKDTHRITTTTSAQLGWNNVLLNGITLIKSDYDPQSSSSPSAPNKAGSPGEHLKLQSCSSTLVRFKIDCALSEKNGILEEIIARSDVRNSLHPPPLK